MRPLRVSLSALCVRFFHAKTAKIFAKTAKPKYAKPFILGNIFSFFIFLIPFNTNAQEGNPIEIIHADNLHAEHKNGEDIQRLKGSVVFKQNDVTMHCDSAILFTTQNLVNAFGHIDINQHDTLHLYSELLDYNGKTKYAIMRQNVKMTDRGMILLTDRLDYDFTAKESFYTTGGTITDAENKLTSKKGYYFSATRDMFFKGNVVLVNPQFVVRCDTLQYNIISKRAIFHGPTTITGEKDFIYCESGWYNTVTNKAEFGKNAYLKTGKQVLYSDSLYYDRKQAFGKGIKNIRIVDTSEHLLITGDYSEHYASLKKTFITRHVLVTKGMKTDSIYMVSDTLWAMYDSTGKYRILKGYYHAKVYNKQFQAVCDSLIYSAVDSTLDLRTIPAMWFDEYQVTGKRILIHTKKNKISRADVFLDAFMVSQEDSLRYSQIKGRNMVGYFRDNELFRIDVDGNSEAMYYVRDEHKLFMGMNKIVSSDIKIDVKHCKISRINFIRDPDADMIPIKDVNPYEARLPGFKWLGNIRPKSREDIQKQVSGIRSQESEKSEK